MGMELTRCLTRAASVEVPDWDYCGVSTWLPLCARILGPQDSRLESQDCILGDSRSFGV